MSDIECLKMELEIRDFVISKMREELNNPICKFIRLTTRCYYRFISIIRI
jgi:hypothetical protein